MGFDSTNQIAAQDQRRASAARLQQGCINAAAGGFLVVASEPISSFSFKSISSFLLKTTAWVAASLQIPCKTRDNEAYRGV